MIHVNKFNDRKVASKGKSNELGKCNPNEIKFKHAVKVNEI